MTEDVEFSRVDDLLDVLDTFDVERAAVVGNSQGGQIALGLAVSRPDRMRPSSSSRPNRWPRRPDVAA